VMGDLESVHAYLANDSSDPWKVFSPDVDPNQNDLENMTQSWGYWVRMNETRTWVVDET